jgi:RNA polymerase sigma-70 factor (ECF subfamily)
MHDNLPTSGEEELIRRAIQRDAEAFGDLYMLYLDNIYRYVYYKVGNVMEAEDLTEQVFLRAWEALEGYRHRGHPFSSWLYRIAYNLVVDYYRAKKDVTPIDSVSFALTDDALGPEDLLIRETETVRLQEAIGQLQEVHQHVLLLRFVEGLSHREVGQIIGKSEGAVRVIQHRALAALGSILGQG